MLSPLLEIGGTWQKYPQLYKSKLTHLILQKFRNFTSISFWPGNSFSALKQRKCKLAGKFRWCTLRPKFGPNLQASCRQLSNSSCSRCKLVAEKTQGGSLWCPNYVKLGWSKANLWRRGGGGIYIGRLLQYLLVPLQYLLVALSIFPLSPCYISFSLCPLTHLAASPPPLSAM